MRWKPPQAMAPMARIPIRRGHLRQQDRTRRDAPKVQQSLQTDGLMTKMRQTLMKSFVAMATALCAIGLGPVFVAAQSTPPAGATSPNSTAPTGEPYAPADALTTDPNDPALVPPDVTAPGLTNSQVVLAEPLIGRLAVLRGLDKVTGRTIDFRAPIGQAVRFRSLEITARACEKAPPEAPPEVSVFVEVSDMGSAVPRSTLAHKAANAAAPGKSKQLFSGWMFSSSPGLSALEHPVYDVWVIDCRI